MKTKLISQLFTYIAIVVGLLTCSSCLKNDVNELIDKDTLNVEGKYTGFTFKTVKEYTVSISASTSDSKPISNAYFELFTTNPLAVDGTLVANAAHYRIFKGSTNNSGSVQCMISTPATADSIYALSYYIGLPTLQAMPLIRPDIKFDFAVSKSTAKSTFKASKTSTPIIVNGFYTLGTWKSNGVPNYFEASDAITQDFLEDVNASLPERIKLTDSHPQYISNNNDASIKLIKDAEVWLTFVHEGAGWTNSLGYYTYPTNTPPTSVAEILDRTIIFPNVSLNGTSLLTAGNKVQLMYLDPQSHEYTPIFPAGTSVGWFLIAQGWNGTVITNGTYINYSNPGLNIEPDANLKKHNVLLWDEEREVLVIGFEDTRRDNGGCDQDFNDAIFYTTISPYTAIDNSIYQPIDTPTDTDGDGITDAFDLYPTDPDIAFDNFYPGENIYGTLAYEDLWPHRGDYDFNDLVLDYNFSQITNSNSEITGVRAKIVVKAIGASYHNAFGIEINTPRSNILSVTGQRNTKGYLNIGSNGAENNQDKAVIMIFDDAFNALPYPGSGIGVNVNPQTPYVTPDTLDVLIRFVNPVSFFQIGTPPYNPFIVVNRNRGVEVHLPNLTPTMLADLSLLGTGDDNSNAVAATYYVSDKYLPWAMNIPVTFDYPTEKTDIRYAHLVFNQWALSRGYNYMDWYTNRFGYRDASKIYPSH